MLANLKIQTFVNKSSHRIIILSLLNFVPDIILFHSLEWKHYRIKFSVVLDKSSRIILETKPTLL